MARDFLTIPEELLEIGERIADHLEQGGFGVRVEDQSVIEAPYLATLRCRRGTTTMYIEVVGTLPSKEHLREWKAFCSSRNRDTRYALCLPLSAAGTPNQLIDLQRDGIGLYAVDGDGAISQLVDPHDLALNLSIPSLAHYPNKVRRILGASWEELRKGNWREGFDGACVALETAARKYLKRHAAAGRISFQTPSGKAKPFTNDAIERMTMGALKDAFSMIVLPNHADSTLQTILADLNPDRILVAHKRQSAAAETKLRRKVPGHLWSIIRGVEQATK